jgi:hypothetical protein
MRRTIEQSSDHVTLPRVGTYRIPEKRDLGEEIETPSQLFAQVGIAPTVDETSAGYSSWTDAPDELPISDETYNQMLRAQAELAADKVMFGLDRQSEQKLQMLRWAIGRAEAARYSDDLRNLQQLSKLHEKLAKQIADLVQASSAPSSSKVPRR